MAMIVCASCSRPFFQHLGRPAKRCKECRAGRARYGAAHQALVSSEREFAYGLPCARCGELLREDQPIDLDHADDGVGYLGWSHAKCNRAAGAAKGNRSRAAVNRAAKGLPPKPPPPREPQRLDRDW